MAASVRGAYRGHLELMTTWGGRCLRELPAYAQAMTHLTDLELQVRSDW
jgi:hypothetical protein